MSNQEKVTVRFPPGRIVSGDVYKGNTTDIQGNPLVIKTGPNAGQPKISFYIGVAIPKTAGVPWENEVWGQQIMNVARLGVPNAFDVTTGQLVPGRSFAFKVTDGDSQIANQNNKRPCDQEGFPGHWVLNFNNGFAPNPVNQEGDKIVEPDAIKRGYWAEVYASITPNTDQRNSGVFLNHEVVSLAGYGQEIHGGIDAKTLGFGQTALPAGVSATPVASATAIATPAAPVQQVAAPVQQVAAPVQQVAAPVQQVAAPVQPATDLVQAPVVAAPVQPVEDSFNVNGNVYLRSQLMAMPGWTEEMVNKQQKA